MIRGKKVIAAMMAVAMTATMLVGCGGNKDDNKANNGGNGEQITLAVSGPALEQDLMKELCDKFAKQEGLNIKFDYRTIEENDALKTVSTDASKAPDVFMYAGDHLYPFVKGGYLFDLTSLESDLGLKVDGVFNPDAIATSKMNDKLYGLPFTPNVIYLFYNKELLDENDVKSLEGILSKDTGDKVKNFSTKIQDSFYVNHFFNGAGCTIFGADGTDPKSCTWNDANGVATVKYLKGLVANKKYHENTGDAINMLKKGELASVVAGDWDKQSIKEALGDKFAAAVLPTFKLEGKECSMKPFYAYKQIGVNAKTKNPEVAARLAYFLANKESQERRTEVRGYAPTITELMNKTYEDPSIAVCLAQATPEHTVLQPGIPEMGQYWTPAEGIGVSIYKNEKNVSTDEEIQKALDNLVTTITTPATN